MSTTKTLEANSIPIPPQLVGLLKKTLGKTGNGFDEGAFLQQLHYWIHNTQATGWMVNGTKWIYNSLKSWQQQFPWMSEYGLRKAIANLKKLGLIQTAQHWSYQYKRVMFYRIDYEQLKAFAPDLGVLITVREVISDQIDVRPDRSTDPNTSSEISLPEQQPGVVPEDVKLEFADPPGLPEQGIDPGMQTADSEGESFPTPGSGNNSNAQLAEFPELIHAVRQAIGQAPSKPLKQAIAQHPERVEQAIAYLHDQQQQRRIKNPVGYLYQAITEEWDLTISGQSTVAVPDGFNHWFNWAKGQGFVIAATTINGTHHTLHIQHGWLPTKHLMQSHPKQLE